MGVKQVGVALEPARQVGRNPARLFHIFHKGFQVIGQPVVVFASQADIQEAALAEHPGITFQVSTEPELRGIAPGFAGPGLFRGHLELHFLGRYHGFVFSGAMAKQPRNRAEVSACSDQQWRLPLFVDGPVAVFPDNGFHRGAQLFECLDPVQQIGVKLATAYAVTDGIAMVIFHGTLAHHANAEPANGLKGASMAVVVDINVQALENRRSDPAGAGFVPGKFGLIDNQHLFARRFQCTGESGACWAGSDNDDIVVVHHTPSGVAGKVSRSCRCWGSWLLSPWLNTTWTSCREPALKAAVEPARYNRQARVKCSSYIRVTSSWLAVKFSIQWLRVRA